MKIQVKFKSTELGKAVRKAAKLEVDKWSSLQPAVRKAEETLLAAAIRKKLRSWLRGGDSVIVEFDIFIGTATVVAVTEQELDIF